MAIPQRSLPAVLRMVFQFRKYPSSKRFIALVLSIHLLVIPAPAVLAGAVGDAFGKSGTSAVIWDSLLNWLKRSPSSVPWRKATVTRTEKRQIESGGPTGNQPEGVRAVTGTAVDDLHCRAI